ncbi:tRNA dimethylallyltransferase [hydrothermal vent metagenome]|uniref:tRNA dimethylallyltransferase n=1 Tax=hydrothermal vent metagenome TaxID=652676 RepID=A0A3B0REA1_9ZZZZ
MQFPDPDDRADLRRKEPDSLSNITSKSETAPILLVFGPTASGKTGAAIALAKKTGGEVINADSMQLYQGLPILTALPSKDEQDGVPHHLFGTVEANARWSTGTWLKAALHEIEQIRSRGQQPILVGGTGLYFEALTKGLAKIPPVSEKTKQQVAALADDKGLDYIREQLQNVDPAAAARIQGADRQRLLRAWSVYLQTGQSLSTFQQNTKPLLAAGDWQSAVILPQRQTVYQRINARFDQMMNDGALEEVQAFQARWDDRSLPLYKAIGVQSLLQFMDGKLSLDAAVEDAKRQSRRYAKRQMTWARGRTQSWQHVADADAVCSVLLS